MASVRRLPIVGDVHLQREEWPFSPNDWKDLLSIWPAPVQLNKIVYSVNEKEKAFDAISLRFKNQKFEAFDMAATQEKQRVSIKIQTR